MFLIFLSKLQDLDQVKIFEMLSNTFVDWNQITFELQATNLSVVLEVTE